MWLLLVLPGAAWAGEASLADRIGATRLFQEPMVWVGEQPPAPAETEALHGIVTRLRAGFEGASLTPVATANGESVLTSRPPSPVDFSSLEEFIGAHPRSGWTPSLRANLGCWYREEGWYSRALTHWERAWEATRHLSGSGKRVADYTLAHWTGLLASLGRVERLAALFAAIEGRTLDGGPLQQRVNAAHEGYAAMRRMPGVSFQCGTYALQQLARALAPTNSAVISAELMAVPSPEGGFPLTSLLELATRHGLKLVAVERPSRQELIVPSVVHWRQNHYAAIVDQRPGRCLVVDPTFGRPRWLRVEAIEEEASGVFLVAEDQAPGDWRRLSREETDRVYGKGAPNVVDDYKDQHACGMAGYNGVECATNCTGMARWWVSEPYLTLWFEDEPLGYQPSRGPRVAFRLSYKERNTRLDSAFGFSVGLKWEASWMSRIEVQSLEALLTPPYALYEVTHYMPGGGATYYTNSTTTPDPAEQPPEYFNRDRLVPTTDGYSFSGFDLLHPDGSHDLYQYFDGPFPFPFSLYLSAQVDPSGHTTRFEYETTTSVTRLVRVIDVDGRTNHVRYTSAAFPRSITEVEDPFGRVATGQMIWYDYPDKPNANTEGSSGLPAVVARLNPDGVAHYTWDRRNAFGQVTNRVETYTKETGGRGTRTNAFVYATNGIDLLQHMGPGGELLAQYAYNTNHQATAFTNAVGEVTAYTYNTLRQLARVDFPGGLVRLYTYFSSGAYKNWLQSVRDAHIDAFRNFTYTNGLVATLRDERGLTTTHTWDNLQRLTSTIYPDGTFTSNLYHRLDRVGARDRLGQWTRLQYDPMRRLTTITNALGKRTRFTWCDCGSLESTVNALNQTTLFAYDLNGRRLRTSYPDGTVASNAWNRLGQLERTRDPAGNWATNDYNHQGLLVSVRNALGTVFSAFYDRRDRLIQFTDASGVLITNAYDDLDRIIERAFTDGTSETFGYSSNGLAAATNRLGHATRYGRDEAGRLVSVTNALLEVVRYTLNPAGDLLTLENGLHRLTRWSVDAFGRVTNKLDGTSAEVLRLAYDGNNRLIHRWTPAKGDTFYSHDAADNLTNIDYTASADVRLAYDALHRLTNAVVAGLATNRFTYTPADLLATEDGPWASDTVTLSYAGQLRTNLSLAQPSGPAWTNRYTYDGARRLQTLASPAGTFVYTYRLDELAPRPDPLARQLSLPNGAVITNAHDGLAQWLETTLRDGAGNLLSIRRYQYDAGGRRTNTFFGVKRRSEYIYDALDQLREARSYDIDESQPPHAQWAYTYDAANNLATRTKNQLVQTFTVDAANRLNTITRSGTLTVAGYTTTQAVSVTVNGQPATIWDDQVFTLAGQPLVNGTNVFTAIAQDGWGRKSTNVATLYLPATVSYQHDANGNLVFDGQRRFDYDDENQLIGITVTNAWRSAFAYDALRRRIQRKEYTWSAALGDWQLTNEVRYVYEGSLVIQERGANNAPVASYTRGLDLSGTMAGAGGIGGLLARTEHSTLNAPPSTFFYHADAQGNVAVLIDAAQHVVARYDYDPFGHVLAAQGPLASANPYRFSSKEQHAPSGLYDYGRRYYEPGLQRWLNEDPAGEEGGMNLYAYVENSPLDWIDVEGLSKGRANNRRSGGGFRSGPVRPSGPGGRYTGADIERETRRLRNLTRWERDQEIAARERALRERFRNHRPGDVHLTAAPAPPRQAKPPPLCPPNSLSNQNAPPDVTIGSQRHHSDPLFLGGNPNQPLSILPTSTHQQLHRDLNSFLRTRADTFGNNMAPRRGNSGERIRENFSRQERLDALSEFYRGNAGTYPEAARDFFNQR